MATRNSNPSPATAPAAPETPPKQETPLPTHGGLYEFDPQANAMRALEGGPPKEEPAPAEQPAQAPSATTGDPA